MRASSISGLTLVIAAMAAFAPRAADPLPLAAAPTISVWLDLDRYNVGEWAVAHFSTGEDGYVVVIQVDAGGNARILFPARPTDDDFVRAGQESTVRDPAGQGSFSVEGEARSGLVYAAFSPTPFHFEALMDRDRWSLFALDDPQLETDPIGALVAATDRITDTRYVYDVARYTVGPPSAYVLGWDSDLSFGGTGNPCDLSYGYGPSGYSYGCDSYLGYTNFGCMYCAPPILIVPVPPAPPPPPRDPPPGALGGPKTAPRIPVREQPRFNVATGRPPEAASAETPPSATGGASPPAAPVTPPRERPIAAPTPPRHIDPPAAPVAPPRAEPAPRPVPAPAPPPAPSPVAPPPAPQRPPR